MHLLTRVLLLNLPEALRKPEIYQLDLGLVRLVRKQEVLWLQISVTDPMLMEMLDCGEDLAHEAGSLSFGELVHLHNLLEELPALRELHHNVHIAVVYVGLMELYDVRVVYLCQNS